MFVNHNSFYDLEKVREDCPMEINLAQSQGLQGYKYTYVRNFNYL